MAIVKSEKSVLICKTRCACRVPFILASGDVSEVSHYIDPTTRYNAMNRELKKVKSPYTVHGEAIKLNNLGVFHHQVPTPQCHKASSEHLLALRDDLFTGGNRITEQRGCFLERAACRRVRATRWH